MTVKDELHALVERLADQEAQEALDYLRSWVERGPRPTGPSQAFIEECQRATDEAVAPDAVRVPHQAVRAWLQTWATPEEGAADAALQTLEERLRGDARDAAEQ